MSTTNSEPFSTASNGTCRCRSHSSEAPQMCHCGFQLRIQTSWTAANPGRRFMSCPERGVNKCGFFKWLDGPICDQSRNIIPGLLEKLKTVRGDLAYCRQQVQFFKKLAIISWLITFVVCFVAYLHYLMVRHS